MPEITPYTNNLKHLNSLSTTVHFPLTFKSSSIPKNKYIEREEDMPSIDHCLADIRAHLNEYLIEKKQTELKAQLYKTDLKDAPWDYYKLLDA